MNLATASMGTAVGLSSDLATGVIDRFRTLPMARSAILAGRTHVRPVASILCGTIVVITGLRHRLATRQRRRSASWPAWPSRCCSPTR